MSKNLVNGDSLKKYHIGFIEKHITPIEDKIKNINIKIKELTDLKISIGENGYIKFPTAFGGLSMQWGFIEATGDGSSTSAEQTFDLSIPINTMCYCGTGDAQCGTSSWRNLLVNISRQNTNTYRVTWKDVSGTKITTCSARWLIIGR